MLAWLRRIDSRGRHMHDGSHGGWEGSNEGHVGQAGVQRTGH